VSVGSPEVPVELAPLDLCDSGELGDVPDLGCQ
jgi:hypothetical protein